MHNVKTNASSELNALHCHASEIILCLNLHLCDIRNTRYGIHMPQTHVQKQ